MQQCSASLLISWSICIEYLYRGLETFEKNICLKKIVVCYKYEKYGIYSIIYSFLDLGW